MVYLSRQRGALLRTLKRPWNDRVSRWPVCDTGTCHPFRGPWAIEHGGDRRRRVFRLRNADGPRRDFSDIPPKLNGSWRECNRTAGFQRRRPECRYAASEGSVRVCCKGKAVLSLRLHPLCYGVRKNPSLWVFLPSEGKDRAPFLPSFNHWWRWKNAGPSRLGPWSDGKRGLRSDTIYSRRRGFCAFAGDPGGPGQGPACGRPGGSAS